MIIYITPFFPGAEGWKGAYCFDQVKSFINLGFEVKVILLDSNKNLFKPKTYSIDGIDVISLGVVVFRANLFPMLSPLLGFRLRRVMNSLIDDYSRSDLIINVGRWAVIKKRIRFAFRRSFLVHHGFDVLGCDKGLASNNLHKRLVFRYYERLFNDFDHLSVSVVLRNKLLTYFPKIKVDTHFNGVDMQLFYPGARENGRGKFVIGSISNFIPLKNNLALLNWFIENSNTFKTKLELHLYGVGPEKSALLKLIERHNLEGSVFIFKPVPHKKLVQIFHTFDVFVMLSNYEAFGCVYFEAFYSGIPIIGIKDQGWCDVINEDDLKYCTISTPRSYDELTKLIKFYQTGSYRISLRQNLDILSLSKKLMDV